MWIVNLGMIEQIVNLMAYYDIILDLQLKAKDKTLHVALIQ